MILDTVSTLNYVDMLKMCPSNTLQLRTLHQAIPLYYQQQGSNK